MSRPTPDYSLQARASDAETGTSPGTATGESLQQDPNLRAFEREKNALIDKYPKCLAAYCNGQRIAIGRSAEELAESIPIEFRAYSLFIKEIAERPIRLRRPRL